jgi:hypothetical protein
MRQRIGVGLLALALLLAGCSGGGNPYPNGTPTSGGGGYIIGPRFGTPLQQLHNFLRYR